MFLLKTKPKKIVCYDGQQNFNPKPQQTILTNLINMSSNFIITIYESKTGNPIASGFVIDAQKGIFLTINNIFLTNNNNSEQITNEKLHQHYYAKLLSETEEQFDFSIEYQMNEENLCFCKIINFSNHKKIQSKIKEINLQNSDKQSIGLGIPSILLSKSNYDTHIIQEGIVQDINIRSITTNLENNQQKQQLPCLSYLTNISLKFTSVYGSPLLDYQGNVQGLILPINNDYYQRQLFAMPFSYLSGILKQYKQNQLVRRPFIGLSVKSTYEQSQQKGAFIIRVNSDGPAEKANIQLGDIIVEINGIKVNDSRDLLRVLAYKINETFLLNIYRDGKFRLVELKTL